MKANLAKVCVWACAVSLCPGMLCAQAPVYTRDNAPVTPKLEELKLADSVTKDSITWFFEKPARVGQFVNGDWYVVGPVTIVRMNPAPVYDGEVRNGSMLSPKANLHLTGYDSRLTHARWFNPELTARLPIQMKPGDSLMSALSKEVKTGDSPVKSFSVLTCLKEPVPADAFRPGYCDRQQTIYLARNLRRELLPKLARPAVNPATGGRLDLPDIRSLAERFRRPWDELSFLEGAQAEYQLGGYGRAICEQGARATLSLMLDYPPEEKEPLLINYIQYGIDLWAIASSEGFPGWPTLGGWGSGRKWPIVFAGLMLGDEKMASPTRTFPRLVFQEDNQTAYDDCWTGAGVVYGGHTGYLPVRNRSYGWGPYEHLHPTRWTGWIGTSYRTNMTSSTWIGQALAIRILRAEKEWNHDAFLDYCDRWMYEPDPGYRNPMRASTQGCGWDLFAEAMWKTYRERLPEIPGRDPSQRPTDGWQKTRQLKGPSVELKGGRLVVNGQPFFPIILWAEHPARIEDAVSLRANVLAEGCFETRREAGRYWALSLRNDAFLDACAARGLYGIFGADCRTVGHPALLGWIHIDEPDVVAAKAAGMDDRALQEFSQAYRVMKSAKSIGAPASLKETPDELLLVAPAFEWMRKMDRSRPVFLTVGEEFLRNAREKPERCEGFLSSCDAIGCAVYPLTRGKGPSGLTEVADAVSTLRTVSGDRPVFAWIETRGSRWVSPEYVRAEVWMALIRGATGIGYRGWEGLDETVRPDTGVREVLSSLNARVLSLAPALLAESAPAGAVEMRMEGNLACHWKATRHEGMLYIFCQNIDLGATPVADADIAPRQGQATFTVRGLRQATAVEVVGEGRRIAAKQGWFSDEFAPLAAHVYRIPYTGG